jgi:hypothetical protein
VLTGCHCSGDGISLILVGAPWHAVQTEGRQALPAPGRSCLGASLALPARPRGSREDLDEFDITRGEYVEEGEPLNDSGIVGARTHVCRVGCPADAANRPDELALTVASGLPFGAQHRGLSIATTAGWFISTKSTTASQLSPPLSARTLR